MKRVLQSLFLLSAICSWPAQAVLVSPSGEGQVLIHPYYQAGAGQQTLLSIVNAENTGKAIKVHVREALNGRPVATFNLYMGEFDVWTATMFTAPDGRPGLLTQDNSCTVPAIKTSSTLPQLPDGTRFLPLSASSYSGAHADPGPATIQRAASGFIEMIEMGALIDNSDSDIAATHVNGVPFSCAMLEGAWLPGGYWLENPNLDLFAPSGQLSGAATVVQAGDGSAFTIPATALDRFSIVSQHRGPDDSKPDLASAITDPARLQVRSTVLFQGQAIVSDWPQERAIDAVTAALSQSTQRAEFDVGAESGASTDWILTLPTRRFYTDAALTPIAVPPFTARFSGTQQCETVFTGPYDREAGRPFGSIFPIPTPDPCLCSSTQQWSVGGSYDYGPGSGCAMHPLPTTYGQYTFKRGFFVLGLESNHRSRPATGGEQFVGLPVISVVTTRYRRPDGNRGATIQHLARPAIGRNECVRNADPCVP